tara:strand:+ start:59 stop:1246 length:1188 start_codon:yes stop_codon:yes gene_type:complete
MTKENILIIFKDKKLVTKNNDFWFEKFNHKYEVEILFINDFLNLTNNEIINNINNLINSKKIQTVLFEGDHAHIIDYYFLRKISNKVKKGIFLGDDMVWHIVNLITAQQCDFVFSSEPISVLKFKELGIESFFVPIEGDGKLFKDRGLNKIYEVLHFGRDKTIRSDYIDYLEKNGIKVKCVSPYDEESNTMEKLAKLISQSKIVLNFAESANGNRSFNHLRIFKKFYQTKGRIQMAGISNVLCISEYCASSELLYNQKELPFFKSKEECLEKIQFFLSNDNALKTATEKFYLKNLEFEDSKYIIKIKKFIDEVTIKSKEKFETPNWYNILFINQRLRLRVKEKQLLSFLKEFVIILFKYKEHSLYNYIKLLVISLFLLLRYLPFLLIKKIINFSK